MLARLLYWNKHDEYHGNDLGRFHKRGLILIPAWINNHMQSKMWDEISYPFPNFNGCTVEVWERIINFIPPIIMDVMVYSFILS